VSDPRLIVAVMIDEPSAGKHYGGDVAAPVFASVMGSACARSALRRTRRWSVAQQDAREGADKQKAKL
jgi:cell division protein FtsI (penicillin-binding protein 3)